MALIVACFVGFALFFSCQTQSKEKQITSFKFVAPPATGEINEAAKTITLDVPEGTDVTALVPTITISDKATVNPASGQPQNFTHPVVYTVTAENESTAQYTVTVKIGGVEPPPPGDDPVEIISPITVNTTLKNLGLPVDYIFKDNLLIVVTNSATLTIEPGVTIKFENEALTSGFSIEPGATIKAVGTEDKRIQFIGYNESPGSWRGIYIKSNTDNQLAYCDFKNMGETQKDFEGGLQILAGAKVGVSHCKFTNGRGTGVKIDKYGGSCQLSTFDNNVFEGYEYFPPVIINDSPSLLEKFDMSSDFTNNSKKYIEIVPDELLKDVAINQTTVPYYFSYPIPNLGNTLTINEGTTIYLKDYLIENSSGRLVINGTADKQVKFTRLSGSSEWNSVSKNKHNESVINHCIFEYGGKNSDAMVTIWSTSKLTLNNVDFNNAQGYGIQIKDCEGYQLTHTNVNFSNNGKGNVLDCNGNVLEDLP